MADDVARLRRRKTARDLGRSWKGRAWLMVGWLFSLYCVWRVFIVRHSCLMAGACTTGDRRLTLPALFQSCVNLIFGYSRKSHQRLDGADPATAPAQGTDLLTSLLTRLAVLLNIELDIATWSRMIGLALIGGILVANMRNVLGSVSRVRRPSVPGFSEDASRVTVLTPDRVLWQVFKATSMGISASFMLLFLAQLMASLAEP